MRTMSRILADKFLDVIDRVVAALHEQRAIEARRVLRRYRHLLEAQHEAPPLNEIISVNEEDILANANRSDARKRAASRPTLERA